MDGWINLDMVAHPDTDIVFNLEECASKRLPLEDDSVDEIYGSHVIEHIHDTLSMMQELHRVAKNGARCLFQLPYGSSDDAWENPTHVRPYFLFSFSYFSQPMFWRESYGYTGDWKPVKIALLIKRALVGDVEPSQERLMRMVMTQRNVVSEMHAYLQAVKPIREAKRELQTAPEIEFVLI